MSEILGILEKGITSPEQISVMLKMDVKEVEAEIKKYKDEKVVLGHRTLIDWEKAGINKVTAFIELKVTPQHGEGFDKIAERIYQYDNVKTLWLMSGGFDIGLIIEGKTMKEVALFVAERLAPMDQILSTATHFVLRTYKDSGIVFSKKAIDERGFVTL